MGLVTLVRADHRVRTDVTPIRDYIVVGGSPDTGQSDRRAAPFGYAIANTTTVHGHRAQRADTATYYSWARESMRGVFIENKLTPSAVPPCTSTCSGGASDDIAALTHIGIAETTQLVRPVVGALYVAAIHWSSPAQHAIDASAGPRRSWRSSVGIGLAAHRRETGHRRASLTAGCISPRPTRFYRDGIPHQAMAAHCDCCARLRRARIPAP
jgi:hypothetical protein